MDCIFCKIARGEMGELVWQNDIAAAFNDINPKAPTHLLVVPKTHVDSLDHLDDEQLAGQLLMAVREVARQVGVNTGYRVNLHTGRAGGQEVDHLHFHILADRKVA